MFKMLIEEDKYQIKILKKELFDIDIYNSDEIENVLKKILLKLVKKNDNFEILIIDIYIDENYGVIIDIENVRKLWNIDKNVELKINFHLDNDFIYKVDVCDDILNLNCINIYCYNNEFYIKINKILSTKEYLEILKYVDEILYKDNKKILNSIKIK